jgi:hypothetical protein
VRSLRRRRVGLRWGLRQRQLLLPMLLLGLLVLALCLCLLAHQRWHLPTRSGPRRGAALVVLLPLLRRTLQDGAGRF